MKMPGLVRRPVSPIGSSLSLLEGGLSQPVALPNLEEVLARADIVVEEGVRSGTPDIALNQVLQLIQINRLSGLALAKLLWRLSKRWGEFRMEAAFKDEVFRVAGIPVDTTRRYVAAWESIEQLPVDSQVRNLLLERGIKDMVAIAQAEAALGKRFNQAQLLRLAKTTDHSELRETLNELKDKKPSKNQLYVRLRRDGELEAWKSGKRERIGVLFVEKVAELGAAAIHHLIEAAGILEE